MEKLISGDNEIVLMLLMFITGLLTKRFVPWWVYEDVLKKLKEYEEAAPELITEARRLMQIINEEADVRTTDVRVRPTLPTTNPKTKVTPKAKKNPKITPSIHDIKLTKIRRQRLKGRTNNG